jgi:hypothetical protein
VKTRLLLNPSPGFGEIRQVDRWLTERHLTPGDVEILFLDLDGDDDPSVPDIGVRGTPGATTDLASARTDDEPDFPWLVRNAWRAMRDDGKGAMPDRQTRLEFLDLMLKAANEYDRSAEHHDLSAIPAFERIVEDIKRRMWKAEQTVSARPMSHRALPWRGKNLHVTYLSVGSSFDSGAAFRVMYGIDLLIAHDARGPLARTAIMAKRTLDLTPLFEAIYARLAAIEPEAWSLVPIAKPGPTPIILPARRLSSPSAIAVDSDAMFSLLQECAAG